MAISYSSHENEFNFAIKKTGLQRLHTAINNINTSNGFSSDKVKESDRERDKSEMIVHPNFNGPATEALSKISFDCFIG